MEDTFLPPELQAVVEGKDTNMGAEDAVLLAFRKGYESFGFGSRGATSKELGVVRESLRDGSLSVADAVETAFWTGKYTAIYEAKNGTL